MPACEREQAVALLPDGARVACTPWDIGDAAVSGYAWHAPNARAAVLLQHGYGDYALRYVSGNDHLIAHLLADGISVYAFDMRGNGLSSGKRGVVDVEQAIEDNLAARARLRAQPLPVFLVGHSLGGLVTLGSALRDQSDLAGVVVLAPAIKYSVAAPVRWFVATAATLFPAALVPGSKADLEALAHDPKVGQALQADPLFNGDGLRFKTAAGGIAQSRANWPRYHDLQVPVLAIHGTADSSTDPGGSRDLIAHLGSSDKTFISVPDGRHALLDDTDRTRTRRAVVSWINARVGARSPISAAASH